MRTVVLVVCFWCFPIGLVFGQGGEAKPAFEVASVKRAAAHDSNAAGMMRGGPGTEDPGRITYVNAPLRLILAMAYGFLKDYQLEGPDWMGTERYDVAANVPLGATSEQSNQMLQNLLTERFRMVIHHETREFEGYRLVLGKNGSKLKQTELGRAATPIPEGFPSLPAGTTSGIGVGGGNGTYLLTARQRSLSYLLQLLSAQLRGASVDDETGLTGIYDYNLGFVPARFLETEHDSRFPDIRTAVEEQLGLKLVEAKVMLDVVVIDKASKEPLDN